MDRAVKVSRREVNALLAELFEFTENLSSEEGEAGDATITDILYSNSQRNVDCTVYKHFQNLKIFFFLM